MLATRSACAALGLALLLAAWLPAAADTQEGEPAETPTDATTAAPDADIMTETSDAASILDEPSTTAAPELPEAADLADGGPQPFTGEVAREDWSDRRPWRYGTQYLFPLTRGMEDAGVPPPARWPLYVLTVPLDVAYTPLGALAGLYGD